MLRCLVTQRPARKPVVAIQQRGLRKGKAPKKPKYRVKIDSEGQVVPPQKIPGYQPDEVENFRKWLVQKSAIVRAEMSTGISERFKDQMNRNIEAYFETKWGQRMSAVKARAKKKRRVCRKKRRERLLWKKVDDWNNLEEMKENRYLRTAHYSTEEGFKFKKFLAAHREKKRPPRVIESEEEFKKRLDEDINTHLYYAPKMLRKKETRHRLNYDKEYYKTILSPWVHEIRRRARVAELVNEREDAIAQAKWKEMIEKRRQERLERKQSEGLKKLRHWNSVLGGWHEKNYLLRTMKLRAMMGRDVVMAAARDEFLRAINDGSKYWYDSPNECRFLRFRFAFGVSMPFTNAAYMGVPAKEGKEAV